MPSKPAQRNTIIQPEMEAATKVKKPRATKKAAASVGGGGSADATAAAPSGAAASLAEPVNQGIPEGGLATTFTQARVTPPNLEAAETSESSLRYCPVCENYLYMQVDAESQELRRVCRKCGFKEEDAKGGLVMEMMIQQKSSEGYKILLNEFTRKDPRLPHIRKNITCPNTVCDSNKGGKEPDVIYIKYDVVNLMYLYICDICGEQWHSRSRS
jgi:DNA-directed RNA polymerase subunit M/transcription elongation factor TFIIS